MEKSKVNVTHIITGLGDGGAESSLYQLIVATENEATHTVISLTDLGKYGPKLSERGVSVETLGFRAGSVSAKGIVKLWKLLRTNSSDLVQTWMYHADLIGGIIARISTNAPIVWGLHNLYVDQNARITRLVVRTNSLLSYCIPNLIISASKAAADHHKKIGYKNIFKIIPNGYDINTFNIKPDLDNRLALELFSDTKPAFVIGCVARWDPLKDHENLLTAFAEFIRSEHSINSQLILAGTNCDVENALLQKLISDLGLNDHVITLGRRNDIPELMNIFDLTVLSSKSEAFPNVLAESMLCGTPCISTDVGDAKLIVSNFGWIVPSENPHALSKALSSAYDTLGPPSDKELKAHLCREHIIDNFSSTRIARQYLDAWQTSRRQ